MRDPGRKQTKPDGRQGDRPKILRPPEKVIRIRIIEPDGQAVSDDRFDRVQLVLSEMADRHARFIAPHKGCNLLTGIGFCGCCGQRLYTATSSRRSPEGDGRRGHYLCKTHHYVFRSRMTPCSQGWLNRERMDQLLSAFAIRFLEDREFLSAILAHAASKQQSTIVPIGPTSSSVREKIAEVDRRDKRLLDALEAGAVSLAEAKQRRMRLAEERRSLMATLAGVEDNGERDCLPQGIIGRLAAMGPKAWTELKSARGRKKLLETLFMEVFVRGESITAFRLAPSLVGRDSGDDWAWVADVPVTLPEPFRITPVLPVPDIPPAHKQCSRCKTVLPIGEFHASRAACKQCIRADNNARYRSKADRKATMNLGT